MISKKFLKNSGIGTLCLAVLANMSIGIAHADSDPRNFEGTWRDDPRNSPFSIGKNLPQRPETKAFADARWAAFKGGRTVANSHLTCRPTGVQGFTAPKGPVLVVQTADEIVFISQEDREVRRIFLNETEHPKGLKPTYSGHSVGHWEGNTLVVDTVAFNAHGLLDEAGDPHSDQTHLVERMTKSADGKTLINELTVTDPVWYTQPFTVRRVWQSNPGVKLLDYDCAENPREDTFEVMTFDEDWFKPTCMRKVVDGMAADKVAYTTPRKAAPKAN